MADELQFELSQLAYSLVNFTEDDQINFLTSIWKDYFLKEKIVFEEFTIRYFATKLIEKVSKTLKDKEKEFIGIPLQCRILAECFQSKIKEEIIQNQSKLDEEKTDSSHLLEGQQFDMASLYKMLMEEKRKVFRQEKIKFTVGDSHIVDDSIEKSIRKTELHLRKLAVQIIVEEQNHVNTLIPSATSFKSDKEREEKEKQLNESGIRFGLLDEKSDGNTTQFLHRTYAEYLLADYIYNGFFLQENCHNKLLENEPIRKWIVEKFLIEDKYNGVRIFFDSMLKGIINKEWENRIKQRNLPDRLLEFAYLLRDQRKEENWALHVASEGRNPNICLLILGCLNVVQLTESDIRFAIISAVKHPIEQRSDVFHLILNYFNDASDEQLRKMLKILFNSNIWSSLNNTQVEQENLKHFIDFIKANQRKLSWIKIDDLKNMAIFFFRYDYYEYYNLNQHFLEIVLLVCFKDNDVISLMKTAIIKYIYSNNWKIARIEKMLSILQNLGRPNVLPELSRLVLVRKSEKFNQDGNVSDYLFEIGMTGLYRAAFKADLKLIEQEIGGSLENPDPETNWEFSRQKNSVFRLIVNASEDDEITPLYVAAAYGHENLCQKIFRFFKEKEKLLDEILIDAIEYENVLMIKTILKSVKSIWGQNVLLQLLQPVISEIYTYKNHERIFDTVIGIAIQDDENGYQHLNELAFKNENSLMMICNVNYKILKGMIASAGGFDIWVEELMDTSSVAWAFIVFSIGDFLDKLNKLGHIPKLIDVLTTLRPSQNNKREQSEATGPILSNTNIHEKWSVL